MIILRYTENYSKRKFKGSKFYIVVACCLAILGTASWFAVSNFNDDSVESIPEETPPKTEYQDKTPSYTESEESSEQQTAEDVESEPYIPSEEPIEKPLAFTMPVEGEIIKDFSRTNLQFSKTYSDMRLHTGVDIACKEGTAVSSVSDGKVVSVEETADYGTTVTIDHSGNIRVKYSALKEIKVKEGDKVSVGDIIALSDTVPSECNDKPHIHIEVLKDGIAVSLIEMIG